MDKSSEFIERSLPKETNPERGVYNSLDEALGTVYASLVSDEVSRPVDLDNASERTKALAKQWGGITREFILKDGEEKPRFLLEKTLEGERKVVILAKEDEPGQVDGIQVNKYRAEKLIVVGPQGRCVNFLERIPDIPVEINAAGGAENLSDPIENYRTRRFWYSYDVYPESAGDFSIVDEKTSINFKTINSFAGDVASLWHEGGHCTYRTLLTDEEKIKVQSARINYFSLITGSLSYKEIGSLDYLTDRWTVAKDEQFASQWALSDLLSLKNPFGIDKELSEKLSEHYEESYRTYDKAPIPETAVSRLGASVPEKAVKISHNHLRNYALIREYFHQLDSYEGNVEIAVNGKVYSVSIDNHGYIFFNYASGKRLSIRSQIIIGPLKSVTTTSLAEGEIGSNYALDISGPAELLKCSSSYAKIMSVEEDIEKALLRELILKEDEARKKTKWIKNTFKNFIPDIEDLDPLTRAKKNAEKPLLENLGKPDTFTEGIGLSPIIRLNGLCWKINKKLIELLNLPEHLNYGSDQTGKRLYRPWQNLLHLSEIFLREKGLDKEIPDIHTESNKESEKKLIDMAVRYLTDQK